MIIDIFFWLSFLVVVYIYVGFYVLCFIIGKIFKKTINKTKYFPKVSIIIAAYNEEKVIRDKIQNTLSLIYPREKLEIIVVTDGSDDSTVEIIKSFDEKRVILTHENERKGKSHAINRAVKIANADIILFSDANTHYNLDVIKKIAENFYDESIGGVSGRKIIVSSADRAATKGESFFWSYESKLKLYQSSYGSISTADGEIFAIRRELFDFIPYGVVHDDMYLTINIVKKGYRVVYEWDAISAEKASKTILDEFFLKTRYVAAGYPLFFKYIKTLLLKKPLFAFQYFSHKFLRWSAPFYLIIMFTTSFLSRNVIVHYIFLAQSFFYIIGGAGLLRIIIPAFKASTGIFYKPAYFCIGNAAALFGTLVYIFGHQSPMWRKARR